MWLWGSSGACALPDSRCFCRSPRCLQYAWPQVTSCSAHWQAARHSRHEQQRQQQRQRLQQRAQRLTQHLLVGEELIGPLWLRKQRCGKTRGSEKKVDPTQRVCGSVKHARAVQPHQCLAWSFARIPPHRAPAEALAIAVLLHRRAKRLVQGRDVRDGGEPHHSRRVPVGGPHLGLVALRGAALIHHHGVAPYPPVASFLKGRHGSGFPGWGCTSIVAAAYFWGKSMNTRRRAVPTPLPRRLQWPFSIATCACKLEEKKSRAGRKIESSRKWGETKGPAAEARQTITK